MRIYNSMIIWIAIIAFFYNALARNRQYTIYAVERDYYVEKVPFLIGILTFGYIIFWAGMRTGVADTRTYITGFNMISEQFPDVVELWKSNSKAPGFAIFNALFKSLISSDVHVWLFCIATISAVPIMNVTRKRSVSFFYSSFLFITTLNFYWMFNGMRQFLVASIAFGFSTFIEKRRIIPYLLMVLILATVHYTAIILIPIYFFADSKPFGKKIMLFCIIMLMCIVFLNPFVKSLEDALQGTAYSGYTEQFANDDGVEPLRVLVMAIPPILAFFLRRQIEADNDPFINICVNMSVISFGIYFIAMFTSGLMVGRLPIYCELYNLVLIPYLLNRGFSVWNRRAMYFLCTMGYFSFYYILMTRAFGGYYISDLTGLV